MSPPQFIVDWLTHRRTYKGKTYTEPKNKSDEKSVKQMLDKGDSQIRFNNHLRMRHKVDVNICFTFNN